MPYSASTIANYFINRANEEENYCSPMKIQKLVYFAHGWNLGLTGEPLINEQVECWKFGPVINSLYHKLKRYGSQHVSLPIAIEYEEIKVDDLGLLEQIWDSYSKCKATLLSNLTHVPGSPWKITYDLHNGTPLYGTDIPTELIQNYFNKMSEADSEPVPA